jgi:hypothetical protein
MGRRKMNKELRGTKTKKKSFGIHRRREDKLKWILKNWYCKAWNGFILRKICFGHCNQHTVSTIRREILH